MKTYELMVAEISIRIKMMAGDYVSVLTHASKEEKAELFHRSGELRNSNIPFTERVAAEIIHYASSPD